MFPFFRVPSTLCLLFGAVRFALGAVDITTVPQEDSSRIVPNAYIVQLSQSGSLKRSSPHEDFYGHLNTRGTSYTVRQSYDSDYFIGAAISVQSPGDLVNVVQADTVVAVYQIYMYDGPRLNPTVPPDPQVLSLQRDPQSPHKMTGIDKLHAKGYKGKGIKIGLIDSGVDYYHPALGGGFGPSFKIFTGYDFVGDTFASGSPPQPDNDPLDTCYGHGTATAGALAADYNTTYNFIGAAPEAKIGAYRVFGCAGTTSDDILIQALLRASKDGMDVINLSLSSPSGWSSAVLAVVANNIANSGKIIVATVGNNGAYGPWYPGAPATGSNVISVGSVDSTNYMLRAAVVSNGYGPIPFLASTVPINPPSSLPIAVAPDEYACTIDNSTVSLAGTIAIIRRGNCAFATKIANVRAAGGQYGLFVNNIPAVETILTDDFPSGLILTNDGNYLINQYKAFVNGTGPKIELTFPADKFVKVNNTDTGGLISGLSSWGPNYDLFMKPNLMAPGGFVLTTALTKTGYWALDSGTSLSAPLVAGAAALLLQAKGKSAANDVRDLFQSTALTSHTSVDPTSPVYSLARQGAGLVQVYDAVTYSTVVTPSVLHLNDTTYAKYTHTIWVRHSSWSPQRYTITHVPSATVLTMKGIQVNPTPGTSTNAAGVVLSKTTITVYPWVSTPFTVTFTPPSGLDATTFPVFSGQIKITNAQMQEELVTSYIGAAASLKNMKVIDNTNSYFGGSYQLPLMYVPGGVGPQIGPRSYTFKGSDYPLLYYRLTAGSAVLHVDLVNANMTLPAGVTTKRAADPELGLSDHLEKRSPINASLGVKPSDPSSLASRHLSHARTRQSRSQRNRKRHLDEGVTDQEEQDSLDVVKRRDTPSRASRASPASPAKKASRQSRASARRLPSWLWGWLRRHGQSTGGSTGSFDKVPIIGELRESWYQSRNTNDPTYANNGYDTMAFKTPVFANQTTIPNGSYRILMRALKITGDQSENLDYEQWLSPVITVAA